VHEATPEQVLEADFSVPAAGEEEVGYVIAIEIAVLIDGQQDGDITVGERSRAHTCCRRQSGRGRLDLNSI
jgi:hypothetical protein